MTGVATPAAGRLAWDTDVRALVFAPDDTWDDTRPFARVLAELLLEPGEGVGLELRDEVLAAAVNHADARSGDPRTNLEEVALREGIRGLFWLPDPRKEGGAGIPEGPDIDLVANPTGFSKHRAQCRQRWAAVRYGRVKGVEYGTAASARSIGSKLREELAARLTADLVAWFGSDDAVDSVAVGIESQRVKARFKAAPPLRPSLAVRLRLVAEVLGRVPPFYPQHLNARVLAEGRHITDAPEEVRPNGPSERFFTRPSETRGRYDALPMLMAERRCILLGDPGSGKSTLARAVVLAELDTSDRAVAVLASAALLVRHMTATKEPWQDALARVSLELTTDATPAAEDVTELAQMISSGPHVRVVLDGIDEVLDASGRHVLDHLITELERIPGRVLLTSRLIGHRHQPGWREVTTLPLTNTFEGLLEQWYRDTDARGYKNALAAYTGRQDVRNLVSSPVLAGMVAELAGRAEVDLSAGRSALYDQATIHFCEQAWKRPGAPTRDPAAAMALRQTYMAAAWTMAVGPSGTDATQWSTTTSYAELFDAGVDVELLRSGDLLTAYGPSTSVLESHRPWIWLHRSFADFLVGKHLAALWARKRKAAEAVMRDAVQYPTAWTEPLRFFAELAPEPARDALVRIARVLCAEGDPGGVVHNLMADVLSRRDRHHSLFATQGLGVGETAAEFRIAEWVNNDGPPPSVEELRTALETAPQWITRVEDAQERTALADEYLRTHPGSIPIDILYAFTPDQLINVAIERILDPTYPDPIDVSDVPTYENDPAQVADWLARFGKVFSELRFPQTVRVVETLRAHALSLQHTPDDELRLALWMLPTLSMRDGFPEPARIHPDLARRVLRGEWGPWGAFNAGLLYPDSAHQCSDASPHAMAGARIAPLTRVGPKTPVTDPRPEDLSARFDAFQDGDLSDIDKVARLVDALAVVDEDLDDADAKALLLLVSRLGGVPEKGDELQRVVGGTMVYDESGLRRLLRGVFWELLGTIEQDRLEALALDLHRDGAPVSAVALPGFALYDNTPAAQRHALELIEFALRTAPSRLDGHAEVLLSETDTTFTEALLARHGAQVATIPGFLSQLVWGFGWSGKLPAWRARLLELQQTSSTVSDKPLKQGIDRFGIRA